MVDRHSLDPSGSLSRRFLVVADGTPESMVAMRYAARRAQNTDRGLVILSIIKPSEFQHWTSIADTMRDEAYEEAEIFQSQVRLRLQSECGLVPEMVIREGTGADAILQVLQDDPMICLLVLGAATGPDGPGPLVTRLAHQQAGTLPVPVTIVPGTLTDATLRSLTCN